MQPAGRTQLQSPALMSLDKMTVVALITEDKVQKSTENKIHHCDFIPRKSSTFKKNHPCLFSK